MEGRLTDIKPLLMNTIVKRVQQSKYEVYGEKNLTYAPFIEELYELLGCKFIFLIRDGRDVVRSLMDWHDLVWGNIYRECKYLGELTEQAYKNVSAIPIHKDTSDFSRPRPQPGDPYHENWLNLTREEMCAWYWQHINTLYINQLLKLPPDSYIIVDYTAPEAKDITDIADFLNLRGLNENKISVMLESRINSVKDRFGIERRYPKWYDWSSDQKKQFDRIAGAQMRQLGFFVNRYLEAPE